MSESHSQLASRRSRFDSLFHPVMCRSVPYESSQKHSRRQPTGAWSRADGRDPSLPRPLRRFCEFCGGEKHNPYGHVCRNSPGDERSEDAVFGVPEQVIMLTSFESRLPAGPRVGRQSSVHQSMPPPRRQPFRPKNYGDRRDRFGDHGGRYDDRHFQPARHSIITDKVVGTVLNIEDRQTRSSLCLDGGISAEISSQARLGGRRFGAESRSASRMAVVA
jgi:hypothetical protein